MKFNFKPIKIDLKLQNYSNMERVFPERNLELISVSPKITLDILLKNYINLSFFMNPYSIYFNPYFIHYIPKLGFDLQISVEKSMENRPNFLFKGNVLSYRTNAERRFYFNRLGSYHIGTGLNGYNYYFNTDLAKIIWEQNNRQCHIFEIPLIKFRQQLMNKCTKPVESATFLFESDISDSFKKSAYKNIKGRVLLFDEYNSYKVKPRLNTFSDEKINYSHFQLIEPTNTTYMTSNVTQSSVSLNIFLIYIYFFFQIIKKFINYLFIFILKK